MTATVAGWIDYAALRGDTVAGDTASEQALVRAQDYIRTYFPRAVGTEAGDEATYIAAGLELSEPGFWSVTGKATDAKVLTEVGASIKWTPIAGGSAQTLMRRHNRIEELLWQYSRGNGLPYMGVV